MEKSLKKQLSSHSRSNLVSDLASLTKFSAVLACGAAVCFYGSRARADWMSLGGSVVAAKSTKAPQKPAAPKAYAETYQDLIEKAQNLSLQKDRLQASQILVRALARESKGAPAFKALSQALDELMTTFYTERAQSSFTAAESNLPLKPRDAIEGFSEALKLEDGNVTILKALSRVYLGLGECTYADPFVTKAEALDPYASEILLLRLQVLDCEKQIDTLSPKLFPLEASMNAVELYARGLQVKDLIRRDETKRAKALVAQWEAAEPTYPEVYYWKWMLSKTDRTTARKYVELCQNLTPRKRKSYNLDVDLCKGKETVDTFLKEPPHED